MAKQTKQSGGVLSRVTGLVGRGAGRTRTGGGGLPGKAAGFVAGFLSGDESKRGRGGRSGRRSRSGRAARGRRR